MPRPQPQRPACAARVLAVLLALAAGPLGAEPRKLGEVAVRCDARELRVKGEPDGLLPMGKYEWVQVDVGGNIVHYDCGVRRRSVFCELDTDFVRVRRTAVPGTYRMECWGDPPRLAPLPEAPASAGTGAAPDSGAGEPAATAP